MRLSFQHFFPLLFCLTALQPLYAQVALPVPKNIAKAYANGTRSPSGTPGKKYWQNTADYKLNINFNPETLLLQGVEEVVYVNNSPDTLTNLVVKLYPNLYKKGAERLMKINPADIGEGIIFDQLYVEKKPVTDTVTEGTNFLIRNISVLPSSALHLHIQYHYTLNKGSHIRTGEIEPGADFIAYFFPRIAVYDDVDGWNTAPYLGSQEFYNDFCQFDVNIMLPKNYIAWCTGTLANENDVLQKKYADRLNVVEKSDSFTTVIDENDIVQQNITADKPLVTWHFIADSVTDVAFAVSNHYLWKAASLVTDSSTLRRTRVDAVFNPKHADFADVISYAKQTVQLMSFTFPKWPFPYPHETVFDGLDQMEYPMMVNDNPLQQKAETIELTDHEIFHTMFPFYMGINETKYAWMDEGWATMGEWMLSPLIDSSDVDNYGVQPYEEAAGTEQDLPISTLSTQQNGTSYFLNSYPKPAFGYFYIKDMLGNELFLKALHHYISAWHGKHPLPQDFFAAMNEGAGQNMNWFWRRWYFDSGTPDMGMIITTAAEKKIGGKRFTITITNKGGKPLPVDVTILFAKGAHQIIHKSVDCWKNGNATITLRFSSKEKINKFVLGSLYTPDTDKKDNVVVLK